jgi:hypothetical protein
MHALPIVRKALLSWNYVILSPNHHTPDLTEYASLTSISQIRKNAQGETYTSHGARPFM